MIEAVNVGGTGNVIQGKISVCDKVVKPIQTNMLYFCTNTIAYFHVLNYLLSDIIHYQFKLMTPSSLSVVFCFVLERK